MPVSTATLNGWDILVVVAYFLIVIGIGFFVSASTLWPPQLPANLGAFRPCIGLSETRSAATSWLAGS